MRLKQRLMRLIFRTWYPQNSTALTHFLSLALLPLAGLYQLVTILRRLSYRWGIQRPTDFPVPVIVVGNLSIGGTGKTPLVTCLAKHLQEQGYKPGIVSRGYRGNANAKPYQVSQTSSAFEVGDEPLMLLQQTGCPVVICKDRVAAVRTLLANNDCDCVLSDDGLQHMALARDIEIAVLDGKRRLGNGRCLPAGPLRESASRLTQVDFIVANGEVKADSNEYGMQVKPGLIYSVTDSSKHLEVSNQQVHALTGIGNPERFFRSLQDMGFTVITHRFPDHHAFTKTDIDLDDEEAVIIMTEKDAVKCQRTADHRHWALAITAEPDPEFLTQFDRRLESARIKKTREKNQVAT